VTNATAEPFHTGTICQGGTACQAQLIDRRLGDYFSVGIDGAGQMYAVYSDTRQGGAVSLASFLHQSGGPSFRTTPLGAAAGATTDAVPAAAPGGTLPRTGGDGFRDAGPGLFILLAAGAVIAIRRRLFGTGSGA
jgi:hypothetical protein